MINLTGKSVFVKTQEEYLSVLKIAKLQGFTWARENHLNHIVIPLPNILNFYDSKIVTYSYVEKTLYEASELLGTKEITAREFIERIADISKCCGRECIECVLDETNTKCDSTLCNTCNWESNIDELLEIAKSGRFTISTTEEKAIEDIEKFIKNPDCLVVVNNEFVDALKLAVKKLKGEK